MAFFLLMQDHLESANDIFIDTGITITMKVKGYPGGAIGHTPFIKQFMERKKQSCLKEVQTLGDIAKSQTHAAYAAFTHGLC